MKHACTSGEELAAVLDLVAEDPVRIAHEECPRCSALLAAMREFLEDAGPIEAREDELERVLARALSSGRAARVAPRARRNRAPRAIWAGLGAIAVAAAVGAVLLVRDPAPVISPPSGRVRGVSGSADEAALRVTIDPDRDRVNWSTSSAAASYQIEVFSARLDTLAVVRDVRDTTATLGSFGLPETVGGVERLLRVVAIDDQGDVVAVSPLTTWSPR